MKQMAEVDTKESPKFQKTTLERVKTPGGILLACLGLYSFKCLSKIGRLIIQGKPSLVRQTSRVDINDVLKHLLKTTKRFLLPQQDDALKNVILHRKLEAELNGFWL